MTKVNKIIKYRIRDFVDPLIESDMSVYSISNMIKEKYRDIPDLANSSHMIVQRHKEWLERNKLQKIDESENDMVEFIKQEYRDTNQQIRKDLKKWSTRIDKLYKKAEGDGSYSDISKVIQQATKTAMDQLKLSESKMDRLGKQIRTIGDINQKKVQNLNIIMLDIANNILCNECKKRVLKKLLDMEDNVESNVIP